MKDLLLDKMNKAEELTHQIVQISFDHAEITRLIDLIEESKKPADIRNYEKAYMEGYHMGWQRALVEVVKSVKGMKWYGGNNQEISFAGMFEHHAE